MKLEAEVRHKSEDIDESVLLDVVRAIRRRVHIVNREYDVPFGRPHPYTGARSTRRLAHLDHQNKPDGFACVSCAWAKPAVSAEGARNSGVAAEASVISNDA